MLERSAAEEVTVSSHRETWFPEARRFRRNLGLLMVVCFAASFVIQLANGDRIAALVPLGGMIVGGLGAWDAIHRRVEADDEGLWIVGLFKTRVIRWADIREVRGDAGDWSTKLVAVKRDGEVVNLPLTPTTHRSLVQHWREVAAREPLNRENAQP